FVKAVPSNIRLWQKGQLNLASRHEGLIYRNDEKARTQHELERRLGQGEIVRILRDQRTQHWSSKAMILPKERIEIGNQTVSKLHPFGQQGQLISVHPKFIHTTIGFPRVNAEARMENRVLHPTHKQFRIGERACESATIVTDVTHAWRYQRTD